MQCNIVNIHNHGFNFCWNKSDTDLAPLELDPACALVDPQPQPSYIDACRCHEKLRITIIYNSKSLHEMEIHYLFSKCMLLILLCTIYPCMFTF